MPATLPRLDPIPEFENRIRWTREQCAAMEDAGILDGRYELIDGEILSKVSEKPPHTICIEIIRDWLIAVFGALFVKHQFPIEVGAPDRKHNLPEPDVAATVLPRPNFATRCPKPEDLHLVIEVSDSSFRSDMSSRARLYGRAGIREYWVVDLNGRRIIIHREPKPFGYAQITAYAADEFVSTLARPEATVRVSDLLPPVS